MKHNLKRVLHLTTARDFTVRAVRAWRKLLPDWTPTLDMLRDLDTRPHEHIAAVRIVAEGWDGNDPRWDVLMALLEYERRDAIKQESYDTRLAAWEKGLLERQNTANVTYLPEEVWDDLAQEDYDAEECSDEPCSYCDESDDALCALHRDERRERVVIPIKVTNRAGQVFHSGETTVETPLKAAFLNNVRLVKHLREKDDA